MMRYNTFVARRDRSIQHSTRQTAWSTGFLGVPPLTLTPQMTRITVWPIVANTIFTNVTPVD